MFDPKGRKVSSTAQQTSGALVCSQVPCVGFSIGVERVLSILESKAKVNEIKLLMPYFLL